MIKPNFSKVVVFFVWIFVLLFLQVALGKPSGTEGVLSSVDEQNDQETSRKDLTKFGLKRIAPGLLERANTDSLATPESQSAKKTGSSAASVSLEPKSPSVHEQVQICAEKVEMGTPFKICVYARASDEMGVRFDLTKSFRRLSEINGWMSDWLPNTQLNQINSSAGARPTKVGAELYRLLKYTFDVSATTEGAFDPTFNVFWGLYGFKPGDHREPTQEQIDDRLSLVNFRQVVFDDKAQSVYLSKPGMRLGLGGIGQGYGVDQVASDLKNRYAAGFVDGSGDTYFWGKKPDGSLWIVAIRDPRDHTKNIGRIYGTDFAVTTAGDDEKFFMVGDRRVHHILDPKTGRSATASRQVTVIGPTATEADAFDTATFVLGPEKGRPILESKGLQGIFVTDRGITVTGGLRLQMTEWGEVYVRNELANVSQVGVTKQR